jgi:hypothetical protein
LIELRREYRRSLIEVGFLRQRYNFNLHGTDKGIDIFCFTRSLFFFLFYFCLAIIRCAIAAALMHNLILVENPPLIFTQTVSGAISDSSSEAKSVKFYTEDGSLWHIITFFFF